MSRAMAAGNRENRLQTICCTEASLVMVTTVSPVTGSWLETRPATPSSRATRAPEMAEPNFWAMVPEEKIRPVLSALEEYPAVLPQLMELAFEIREKAHCPLCEALRLMLPAEMRGGRVKVKTEEYARLPKE